MRTCTVGKRSQFWICGYAYKLCGGNEHVFVVSLCRRYNVPIFLKTGLEIHIQTWGRGGVVGRGLGGGTVPADYVKPLRIFGEILGNGNVLDIGHLREISKLCWGPEKTKVFLIYAYGLGLAGRLLEVFRSRY